MPTTTSITSPADYSSSPYLADLTKKWFVPSRFDKSGSAKPLKSFENEVHSWLKEAISEGEGYLKSQRGFEGIDHAIDTLIEVSKSSNLDPETLSYVKINEIKRNIWENCAILSNVSPSTLYEARDRNDQSLQRHVRILNNLQSDWHEVTFVSDAIRGMTQWGFTAGTGYLELDWDVEVGERGGELMPRPRGWANYLPIGMGDDLDHQQAYGGIIKREMDIRTVIQRWPHKAHQIVPNDSAPSMARKIISSLFSSGASINELLSDPGRKNLGGPVVDVYFCYVDDRSINPTNREIPMGQYSWSYTVPVYNQQFAAGFTPDGQVEARRATRKDARLYPTKRLIIATRTCILYDGPSFYWHGKYPVVKYSPDQWIWSYLGYSLVAQVVSQNDSLTQMLRMMEDSLKLQLDPPSMIDEQTPPGLAKKSLRVPGMKIRGRVQMGDIIRPIVKDYKPSEAHFKYLELLVTNIARHLGTPDLRALQQAKQVPSGDSAEKYFAQAGAIVTDMSRAMDKPLWQLADMNRYNFFQFYDLPRRLRILGRDGLTEEDLDFDPTNMIPLSLPGEPPLWVAANEAKEYASTRLQRARIHISNFSTTIERTSAHELTSMAKKLLIFQATKINPANGVVSPETIAREAGVKNWGTAGGDTELEKMIAYLNVQNKVQLSQLLQRAAVEAEIQKIMMQQSPQGQMMAGLQGLAGAASQSGGEPAIGAQNPGRPPGFEGSPTLTQKDQGARSTITGSQE